MCITCGVMMNQHYSDLPDVLFQHITLCYISFSRHSSFDKECIFIYLSIPSHSHQGHGQQRLFLSLSYSNQVRALQLVMLHRNSPCCWCISVEPYIRLCFIIRSVVVLLWLWLALCVCVCEVEKKKECGAVIVLFDSQMDTGWSRY